MSLINEALKKAQRQRSEGTETPAASEPGAPAGPRVARRERPAGFQSQMLAAAGIGAVVLLLVVGGGIYWFTRSNPKPTVVPPPAPAFASHPTATEPTAAASAPAPTNIVASTPTVTAPATPASTPAVTVPASSVVAAPPPASTEPTTVASAPVESSKTPPAATVVAAPPSGPFTLPLSSPAPATSSPPSASTVAAVSAPTPADHPKPSVHMVTIIENLHVAGIRAAGDDSKVLMNDRVYRVNDVVDHELGIKLVGVTAKSLTFENYEGAVYTRNF